MSKKVLHRITRFLKRRWRITAGVFALLALGFVGYQRFATAETTPLTFVQPERQDLVETLEVSGVVDAKERARLRFLGGGKVVYLGAQEGDWVKRGQTLATIDRASLQKQLEQNLNTYEKQRNTFEQLTDDQREIVQEDADRRVKSSAQQDLENSVLSVELQAIAIQNTVLSAPFAGILTTAPTSIPGTQLLASDYFEVINPASLVFRAAVDEADIAKVQQDQTAVLSLDAYPDDDIRTSVQYIAFTSSESSSGTVFIVEFPLTALAEANTHTLRVGMNGDIAIELSRVSDALTVPLNATRERETRVFVDVKTGENTYEEREIQVGLLTEDFVEVLSGLSESDEVLLPEL